MADLTGQQLKNSYQNLVTIDATIESNPTSGQLENGLGNPITALGIGTDSPAEALHVYNPTANVNVLIESGDTQSYLAFKDSSTTSNASVYLGAIGDEMQFVAGGSGAMRIDSSGNVLVGKNASNYASEGIELRPTEALITKDSGTALSINRLTNDGPILSFARESSAIGFIGSYSGTRLGIGSNAATGMIFGSVDVLPATSGTTLADDTYSIGNNSYRWKDLYLSGNVILSSGQGIDFSDTANSSGTMTSELLDDYEEGTFTPTLEGSTTAGTYTFSTNQSDYTKIGRQVTVTSRLIVDTASGGVGSAKFGGLPFTKVTNTSFTGSVRLQNVDVDNSTINISAVPWTLSASTDFALSATLDNASASGIDIAGISTGDTIEFSFTYFV